MRGVVHRVIPVVMYIALLAVVRVVNATRGWYEAAPPGGGGTA